MMNKISRTVQVFFLVLQIHFCANAQPVVVEKIDYPSFLGAQSLQFNTMPGRWEEAPYFGNGYIGSMIYADSVHRNWIRIQVFRTDVQDHRNDSSGWTAYSRPRFMIGYFILQLKGTITSCRLTQNLYTADLTGTITTTAGSITIHHFVAAQSDLIYTRIASYGGETYTTSWLGEEAKSTRKTLFPGSKGAIPAYAAAYGDQYATMLKVYQTNPPPILKKNGSTSMQVQNLLYGGQYVTGWREDTIDQHTKQLTITVKNSYPAPGAEREACQILLQHPARTFTSGFKAHCDWWRAFYARSFVSIPDKGLEKLYWLQLYKLGSAARPGGPIMDTSGPWFQQTPWPYLTWDLNVQLCYWALNTSNHLDLARSLPNALNRYTGNLVSNVLPEAWRADAAYLPLASAQDLKGLVNADRRFQHLNANLPWAMHNVWLMYRYSMDNHFLAKSCYPLLKRSINYYLHLLVKEADGKYHLPLGYSPEYPGKSIAGSGETKDPNIDIALLNWGLRSLMEAAEVLKTDKSEKQRWQEVLQNLVPYATDAQGFMIGDGMPFSLSHRHYSHLLMIYPLYLVNNEQQGSRELIQKSLTTWINKVGALQGYSYTGAASIAAAIGEGDSALTYLHGLSRFLLPNGLYKEQGPCFETPLSAAQSLHDMLLQSWGGKIRFFPAVPAGWKNSVFRSWLAEGAFEVSAVLKNSIPAFLQIRSLAGSPCVFVTSMDTPEGFVNGKKVKLTQLAKHTYGAALLKGQSLVICPAGNRNNKLEIGAVPSSELTAVRKQTGALDQ